MSIEFIPFPLIIGLGILMILLILLWRQKRKGSYLFCLSIFGIYLLVIAGATLFPIPLLENVAEIPAKQRMIFTLSHVNLIPFKYLNDLFPALILREIASNILLTIPFGFGINFIAAFKAKSMIGWMLGPGIAIESAQLAISLGIGGPYHVVDITDILLNATDVLIGYGLFKVFAWLYRRLTQRLNLKHRGLSAYLYDIARHA